MNELGRARPLRILTGLTLGIVCALATVGCDPTTKPAAFSMSWSVFDFTDNANADAPSGGSLRIAAGHSLWIVLHVSDPNGLQRVAITGDGKFQCQTDPAKNNGVFASAPGPLSAGIAGTTQTYPTTRYIDNVITPKFTYFDLSCGTHTYGGPLTGPQEYFAISGTLHVSANETGGTGATNSATLDLSP